MAALANRLDAIELANNRRQREVWEREALDALRHGDPSDAVAAYTHHDRITTAQDAESVREQFVGDWWTATVEHGLNGIMIAARKTDVADLNVRAWRLRNYASQSRHWQRANAAA